ncbi:hypothetical protein [uncultured Zoogloea sp.]|nr:hypothetical protein [uncultured Zoogloea sp.]
MTPNVTQLTAEQRAGELAHDLLDELLRTANQGKRRPCPVLIPFL